MSDCHIRLFGAYCHRAEMMLTGRSGANGLTTDVDLGIVGPWAGFLIGVDACKAIGLCFST